MTEKKKPEGVETLKKDLKAGTPGRLYLFYGEEDYQKRYYLERLKKVLVDENFSEFNLIELEGKETTPDALREAIESYPAFAERKLVVVRDFDLYKPPAAFQGLLPELLGDLPDYICLVFYYGVLELKPDKRMKLHALLDKTACFAEFAHWGERELVTWVQGRVRALGKTIAPDTCSYLIFLCGASMTNLITEIEKAAAHCTLDEIRRYNIDAVCTRVLDAVIFDLTDSITARRFDRAIALTRDLLAQKYTEVAIFTAVLRHIQRLYAVKLNERARGSGRELAVLIGSSSSFYAKKLTGAVRGVSLEWLRGAVRICGETDAALKSSAADKEKILELALLQLAAGSKT